MKRFLDSLWPSLALGLLVGIFFPFAGFLSGALFLSAEFLFSYIIDDDERND